MEIHGRGMMRYSPGSIRRSSLHREHDKSKPEPTIVDINKLTHYLKGMSVSVILHFAQKSALRSNAIGGLYVFPFFCFLTPSTPNG